MAGEEDAAVTNFRDYLKINTVQPQPDYAAAVKFLKKYADGVGLAFKVLELHPGRPIVIMTWEGKDPDLPTLLLNSHIDVVPVFPECWKVDPFSAHKFENGDIYARGSQDMKCVGIQYVEAIRRLKKKGETPLRTIHVSFVPDEEIGGSLGMKIFVKNEEFKRLNVGFALDEGLANPTDSFTVFYGERCIWGLIGPSIGQGTKLGEEFLRPPHDIHKWLCGSFQLSISKKLREEFIVKCPGNPGHGSRFIEGTAGEKLRRVINSFLDFRDKEEKRLNADPSLRLGDVTTVNLTSVEGGVQPNVVPAELSAGFDVRISPTVKFADFEKQINRWCQEAGDGITIEFSQKDVSNELTSIDKSNPWWNAFSSTLEEMNLKYETEIFPAGTDSRYIREAGKPAIGFSPMNNTPILLHDHNEFLNEKIFLKGIDIYCRLIPSLANLKN